MALTVKRGWTNDSYNKIDRHVTAVSLTNADIKESTDVVHPSLVVDVPTATKSDFYTKTNIFYIDAFKRWYSVENIEFLNAGRVLYRCSCDVLKTFASDIKSNTFYVARQENDYNTAFADPILPRSAYDTITLSRETTDVATPSNFSIVVLSISKFGLQANIMSSANYSRLMDALWSFNFSTLFQKNPIENIIRVFALPWSVSALSDAFTPHLLVDFINLGENAITPSNYSATVYSCGSNVNVKEIYNNSLIFPLANMDWKHKDTTYRLILPYVGEMTIPASEVYPSESLTARAIPIQYVVDITNGDVAVNVSTFKDNNTSYITHSARGNAAVELPMSATNVNTRTLSAIGGATTSAVGIAAAIANPEIGALALTGMGLSAATQFVGAANQSTIISGGVGGSVSWALPQNVRLYTSRGIYHEDTKYAATYGKPLFAHRLGSALSGFTQCENVQMMWSGSPTPTETEKQQVKSLLESGVIF